MTDVNERAAAIEPSTYDGDKAPEEIESDIARTRASLSETLDALERRLAPRHLLEKGVDMVRDSMDGNVGRIGQVVREHPVPLALIGAGVGWLLVSQSGAARRATSRYGERVRSTVSQAAGAVGERAGEFAGRVKGMVGAEGGTEYAYARTKSGAETASEAARGTAGEAWRTAGDYASYAADQAGRAGEAGRQAWQRAGEYASQAGGQAGRARDRFVQLMEDYPLAVGALGFLAGTLVAAALPSTRVEDEWMGETRDDLWHRAEEAGRDVAGRAKEVAATTADAAADAAKEAIHETAETATQSAEAQGAKPSVGEQIERGAKSAAHGVETAAEKAKPG